MLHPKPSRRRVIPGGGSAQREVYDAVLARDRDCVAPRLDPDAGPCGGRLTREHVRPGGGAMGAPRVTRVDAVVILCERHHLWTGWATSHKPALRDYLGQGGTGERTDAEEGIPRPGVARGAPPGDPG